MKFQCKCSNELNYKLIGKNIILVYCDKCYIFDQYEINKEFINIIYNGQLSLSNDELTCEKCGKVFCMKCYLEHEDYIDKIRIKSMKYRVKNSHYKTKKITIKTYLQKNYRIKSH